MSLSIPKASKAHKTECSPSDRSTQLGIDYLNQLDTDYEMTVNALQAQIKLITEHKLLLQTRMQEIQRVLHQTQQEFDKFKLQTESTLQLQAEELYSFRYESFQQLQQERAYWTQEYPTRKQAEISESVKHIEILQERLQAREEELWSKNGLIDELKVKIHATRQKAAHEKRVYIKRAESALKDQQVKLNALLQDSRNLGPTKCEDAYSPVRCRRTSGKSPVANSPTDSSHTSRSSNAPYATFLLNCLDSPACTDLSPLKKVCSPLEMKLNEIPGREKWKKNVSAENSQSSRLERELSKLRKRLGACDNLRLSAEKVVIS